MKKFNEWIPSPAWKQIQMEIWKSIGYLLLIDNISID